MSFETKASAVSLAPGAAAPGPARASITSFTLGNGMEVVVIPDARTPVVTHMVWYKNGAADDPLGQSGIAHFLEHLMFKGTAEHPQGEFSNLVAELGGQENAFTSYDYTAYFQRIGKEHLATLMAFEADRMRNLVLTDEVVDPERDVVLEERRMRTDSDPSAQLDEAVQAALFAHHPYGIPIIGWNHEIEGLGRAACARLLPTLLYAGKRHPDRRRRRRGRRGRASRQGHLRQGSRAGRAAAARPRPGAAAPRPPSGDAAR